MQDIVCVDGCTVFILGIILCSHFILDNILYASTLSRPIRRGPPPPSAPRRARQRGRPPERREHREAEESGVDGEAQQGERLKVRLFLTVPARN